MDDQKIMRETISLAKKAFENGEYPIAAAIRIGDEVFYGHNTNNKHNSWMHHAENSLLIKHGEKIKAARKSGEAVELFTTLEPCIMCLGTAILSRVTRIVYACPDPHGGATSIDYSQIIGYKNKRIEITGGLYKEESYELFHSFMKKNDDNWLKIRKRFEEMHATWT